MVAALHEALLQYAEEDGMAALGLRNFLPAVIQAPIIVTFHSPQDPRYQFKDFYELVKAKGFFCIRAN